MSDSPELLEGLRDVVSERGWQLVSFANVYTAELPGRTPDGLGLVRKCCWPRARGRLLCGARVAWRDLSMPAGPMIITGPLDGEDLT
jgi:hypothetical protein